MRYVVQRLTRFLIVFFIVTFTVMVLLRLGLNQPGDPARTMLGGFAEQALIDETNERYHLHDNYLVQYYHWLRLMIFEQDFGFSVSNNTPVATLISRRIMATLLLGLYGITLGVAIAVPLAVRQAYRRDRRVRQVSQRGVVPVRLGPGRSSSRSSSSCCSSSSGRSSRASPTGSTRGRTSASTS